MGKNSGDLACGFECVSVCWQTNYSCYFQIIWGHNLGVCPSPSLLACFSPFKWSALVGFSPSVDPGKWKVGVRVALLEKR